MKIALMVLVAMVAFVGCGAPEPMQQAAGGGGGMAGFGGGSGGGAAGGGVAGSGGGVGRANGGLAGTGGGGAPAHDKGAFAQYFWSNDPEPLTKFRYLANDEGSFDANPNGRKWQLDFVLEADQFRAAF